MTSHTHTEVVWQPGNASGDEGSRPRLVGKSTPAFKANMLGLCALSLALGMLLQHLGPSKTAAFRQLLTEMLTIVNSSMEFLLK